MCIGVYLFLQYITSTQLRARLEQLCLSSVLSTVGCEKQRSPRHFSLFLGFKTNPVLAERPLKIEMGIFLTSISWPAFEHQREKPKIKINGGSHDILRGGVFSAIAPPFLLYSVRIPIMLSMTDFMNSCLFLFAFFTSLHWNILPRDSWKATTRALQ